MGDATGLTRQGRLMAATALIQQALATPGGPGQGPDAPPSEGESGDAPRHFPAPVSARRAPATPTRMYGSGSRRGVPFFPNRRAPGASHVDFAPRPPAPATGRPAGRFGAFSYTNEAGTRAYWLYVPRGYTGGPAPLVVMLHGGTQDATTFAAATGMNELAEREMVLVAYPEQPRSANAGQYWNWFVPDHQRRDAGEPSLIAGITRQVMDRHGVDASRVYVAGFSAGGAMAAVMAAVYPDLYAAVGVHSGLAYRSAVDVVSAFSAMKDGPPHRAGRPGHALPMIVFHGDRDTVVSPINATHLINDVLAVGRRGTAPAPAAVSAGGRVPGGHRYTRTCYHYPSGEIRAECWTIHQGGHDWSGGQAHGSYTDPRGPDASAQLVRFFREHPAPARNG
ncbi:MAG: PHB depolymerase family esterase [Actinomycetota bacterium]|nr:PHB depolymerase family esterase [Actinomycetota bacterium]